jgi:acylpyruvate hydrolase
MAAKRFLEVGRKIIAIGRNYAKHARELNNPIPKSPIMFLKPTSSYISEPESIQVPDTVTELHHEVELGVIIGKGGTDISAADALSHVDGYVLALDMTARNLQNEAKSKGLPWSVAKGYDTFTPVSRFIPKHELPNFSNLELWLKVDGELRQRGNTSQMLFPVPDLIAYASSVMTLSPGDCILTGTPSGVGPVTPGQVITAGIPGLVTIRFPVVQRVRSNL